jgi:hypothetical protein
VEGGSLTNACPLFIQDETKAPDDFWLSHGFPKPSAPAEYDYDVLPASPDYPLPLYHDRPEPGISVDWQLLK